MFRKSMFVLSILLIASFIFGPIALAQSPTPMAQVSRPAGPGNYPEYPIDHLTTQNSNQPGAALIALGQPGTSFRYVKSFGVTQQPYISDTNHLNDPVGIFIDSNNNVYITEYSGNRVLKYDSSGNNVLALGKAGVCITDNYMFCSPKDVALDHSGNIWVADGNRVVQYNASGTFLQQLPQDNPWDTGNDNTHFNDPHGVAFDNGGRMFVSDTNNQRIQIYDISGGSPVYSATIGINGESGSDNSHFNQPFRIAVDSSNRLYVVDKENDRVQRCTYNSGGWSCSTFKKSLNQPQGIALDSSNNVYIADTTNGRIVKCTSSAVCSTFEQGAYWPSDVAVDSSGNVYGAVETESFISKYDSSGNYSGPFKGALFVPYLTDGNHFNHPRVAIDPQGNIIILEEQGQRLVKLDSDGNLLFSLGVPGISGSDNNHFNWPHGVATDSAGKIYVADSCRVQIISPNGVYLNTLGTGCGTGDYEFNWASGIAVDKNGNIYVADYPNHRVEIFNNNLVFIGRIGQTGVCSAANDRLCEPIAVTVDSNGNVFVTDGGNLRVQKFNSNLHWQMTIGNGTWGNSFDQLAWPEDIAVDSQGKIYVTDWSNNRVQIFDSTGAYLTTIGGAWGTNTSQFIGVPGVDLDSKGNVYVTDWENARIQKFAPGVPGWRQANINGFGEQTNGGVTSLEVFQGELYAGTANWALGGRIYRTPDGKNWSPVTDFGVTNAYSVTNPVIADLIEFQGNLYAGTAWDGIAGQVWRSANGTTWDQVISDGFGDEKNQGIKTFGVFNNFLYAGTSNNDGVQIWRSSSGDALSWTQVFTNSLGNATTASGFAVFNNELFAALFNDPSGQAQVWHTSNGTDWSVASTPGFGETSNDSPGGFAVFKGNLYLGIRNDITGAQLWRSNNGTTWDKVIGNGFGAIENNKIDGLYVYKDRLYAFTDNGKTGLQTWVSADGDLWSQFGTPGFGDSNNKSTLWSNAVTEYDSSIFIGTWNGGEVWQMLNQIHLPLIIK